MSDVDWRRLNRANWDERVPIHLAAPIYDGARLRAGDARLLPIEEAELGPVAGLRLLHLQCHFGHDTLILAQRGAEVAGLDFSAPAIAAARSLAAELGLSDRARFFEADLYDAPAVIAEPASFDRVYVTWGAICWLPESRLGAHRGALPQARRLALPGGGPSRGAGAGRHRADARRQAGLLPPLLPRRSRSCWTIRPTMRTARHG